MIETRQIDFLKTFFFHYIALTIFSILFKIFFAMRFDWFGVTLFKVALPLGLSFDLAVAAILAFVFTLLVFITSRPRLIAIPYGILAICLVADMLYFQEAGRHLSYEVWELFNSFSELVVHMVHHFHYFVISALVLFGVSFLAKKTCFWTEQVSTRKTSLSIFICSLVVFISIRGGITGIPQNPALAYRANDHHQAQVALNGAYAMFYSLITGRNIHIENIDLPADLNVDENVQKIYANHTPIEKPAPQKYNIVFFFLEGWPAEYSKSYGYKEDVTPNFDGYRKKSITTTATIAGGKRTTEGMFAALCSYPNPLGKTIMFSHLEGQEYNCLPEILKNKGWHTAYYQGSNNMTSGVGAFAHKVGFTDSAGKKEYPGYNDVEKNSWGLYDRDLYAWTFEEAKKVQEPFFFSIGTNTTHDLMLPKGEPWAFGDQTIQAKNRSVLHMADREFKVFMENMEAHSWKYPVLYVMMSDHTSHVTSSDYNNFRIPFAIYSKDLKPQFFDMAISQRDVAPTVLDLLGMESQDMTGVSLFEKAPLRFADYYHSHRLGYILNSHYIELNIKDSKIKKCYDWRTDFQLENPKECTPEDLEAGRIGLSFTQKTQELLFNDKARKFRSSLKKD